MKNVYKLLSILFLTTIVISCSSTPSLQEYYVENKENNEFISLDIPASILELKDVDVTENVKNTLASIKKVNFLALQVTEENKAVFEAEKQKVKEILKNSNYKQLMRMNIDQGNVSVNYVGEEDAIDEVIIFGSDNSKGFALVRVLGENMNPAEILQLMQEVKMDENSSELKQLEGILSTLK